jgi:RNA polymerase primary sigma factor
MTGKEGPIEVEGLRALMQRGKQQGALTYQEVMNALEEVELSADQIDEVYTHLQSQGIDLVADNAKPADRVVTDEAEGRDAEPESESDASTHDQAFTVVIFGSHAKVTGLNRLVRYT